MVINKSEIIKNICYTKLVYSRINKKLNTSLSEKEIEKLILKILNDTNENSIIRKGKNYYVKNNSFNIMITINSNTYRVITVNKIKKNN
jgi:hypothetical protein